MDAAQTWWLLGSTTALAALFFALAFRAGARVVRMALERKPALGRLQSLDGLSARQAADALERFNRELHRVAAADPEIRRFIYLRRACSTAAVVCGCVPILYASTFLTALLE
jgi:hypothetical protein